MPTLNLRLAPLLNPPVYDSLAAKLTALTAKVLHKRPEVTIVMIDDLPAARFCAGGAASEQAIACLEINITAGTNTAVEKQAFVSDAHALLRQLLGDLHEASYVIVRELPAENWGYGGMTQAQRKLLKTAPSPEAALA
ncbi:MAG: 4-oxalocrotonate tautomerase [Brachymonas sp.]|nr:4-oxalocrotonate tautomerase [Brachymonas sp.]